jgi:hypothetical protein
MSDLTQRMMDAEAEANKHISEKQYQHTASYAKLTGADVPRVIDTNANGKSIHDQLVKRAHIKESMAAADYRNSMLGTNSFRQTAFIEGDEKTRKDFLAKQYAGNGERGNLTDETQPRVSQKLSEKRDVKASDASALGMRTAPIVTRKFSEPTRQRYNPYS